MGSNEQNDKKQLRSLVVWAGAFVVLAAIAFGVIVLATKDASTKDQSQTPSKDQPTSKQDLVKVRQDDWVRGETSAPVTIIEYSDFQCPACGYYYPLVKKVEKEYPSTVRVAYRQFPLVGLHEHALEAAYAAEAAGAQGKFWEMHDTLFEHQKEWSTEKDVKTVFVRYAKSIGLDEKKFADAMGSDAIRDRIKKSLAEVEKIGLQGTPTFFLNGRQIENPKSFEDFRYLIENEK